MRSLFRNSAYCRLFAAQVVALTGTGLATVALALLAHDLAGARSGEVLGTALAIKMVAYVTVSPLVGAWADRVPRRVLLVGADAVRAAVVALLPFVDRVWQVYLLVAVLQSASAAFTPTFQSVLPDVLPDEDDYTAALSASQTAVSLENVLSPLLAAVLLSVMSFHTLFVGTAVGFLGSAVLVAGTRVPRPVCSERTGLRERITAGMRVFAATPRLRAVLGCNLVAAAAGAITVVGTVALVRDGFGGTDREVALLLAVSGLGTAAAALAAPRLVRQVRERAVLLIGSGVSVLAVVGAVAAAVSLSPPTAVGAWLLVGVGGGLLAVPTGRVLRASSTTGDRPAVFAAQFSLSHLCWLVSYPVAGWVGTAAGLPFAWTLLGLLAAGGAVVALLAWPRRLSDVLEHTHATPPHHAEDAHWNGQAWVHTHRLVIDADHRRWPSPVG